MKKLTVRPSSLDAALSSALNELREITWLAAVVAALSVLGIVLAVSLSFALDRHAAGSEQKTLKSAHCPTTTPR